MAEFEKFTGSQACLARKFQWHSPGNANTTDRNHASPEPNWADYIDALRAFEPPTLRLARQQKALRAALDAPDSRHADIDRWWLPPDGDRPRT